MLGFDFRAFLFKSQFSLVYYLFADKYSDDNATYFYPRSGLQYQVRYGSWIDLTTVDPKFSGLQIKFFQNGKVQMKGLSSEDWDKIVHLDEICSRK